MYSETKESELVVVNLICKFKMQDEELSDSDSYSVSDSSNEDDLRLEDCNEFQPDINNFDDTNSGVTDRFMVADHADEYEYFIKFFDIDIINLIVEETNRYYNFCNRENNVIPRPRWMNTTADEMYVFLALVLLMPQVQKSTISEYWSKNPMITTDFFTKYMTRDRFILILRYLHFTNNDNSPEDDGLWKIRNVYENLNEKFSTFFSPFQKLCIDESLVLYKGRLRFKQYIPSKRHRFGLKLFVLCDCETGIILNVLIYTGSSE